MTRLLCDTPIANSQSPRKHPPPGHRAGGITGRDEHDLGAGSDQASGEDIEDVLGAPVCDWRDGQPRWGDDAHPQRNPALVRGLRFGALCHGSMVTARPTGSQGRRTIVPNRWWTAVDFGPLSAPGDQSIMESMWVDERGSEVLAVPECRRLLAIGAKEQRHGHLGVPQDGAPLVLPVNYAVHGPDVVLRIGEGLFHQVDTRLVAFQVDGVSQMGDQSERIWSVLVQGLAIEDDENVPTSHVPHSEVVDPGQRVVRIRADVVTGRRFPTSPAPAGV